MLLNNLVITLAVILQSFAVHPAMFIIGRFVCGINSGRLRLRPASTDLCKCLESCYSDSIQSQLHTWCCDIVLSVERFNVLDLSHSLSGHLFTITCSIQNSCKSANGT